MKKLEPLRNLKLTAGRYLLMIFALTMLPMGTWAEEDYDLTVAGVQVTSENAGNVLNDETATVTFDATTNTLTLHGAEIDMSNQQTYAVVSGIENLTVHLKGNNNITVNPGLPYAFSYTNAAASGTLTLTTENIAEDETSVSFGRLNVDGITDISNIAQGYTIASELFFDENTITEEDGWHYTVSSGYYKSVTLTYVEYYGIWQSGIHINSSNLNPESGGTSYYPGSHTLHLSGFGYNSEIKTTMPELIIEVVYDNTVKDFKYEGDGQGRLIFRKGGNNGSESKVSISDENGAILGFANVVIESPLKVVTPAEVPAQWDQNCTEVFISDAEYYDLTVAGVQVTSANASNVLGDDETPTVVFDAATNTLTLNDANLTDSIVSGLDDLTIFLVGENSITSQGNTTYVFSKSSVSEATITFTTDATSNGSLTIAKLEEYLFGEGVTPVYDKVSIKHDGDYHTISSSCGISVGGVAVTEINKSNVLGDGKVSYNPTSHTLTLNNATIAPNGEVAGISFEYDVDLTIALIGNNSIRGGEGCTAISKIYGVETPHLYFVKADANQHFSLNIIAQYENDLFEGFTPDYGEDFFVTDEEDDGTFTRTISSTMFGGTGSAAEPFLIKTADDLKNFAINYNEGRFSNNVHIQLFNDINCEGVEGFTTIADNSDATFYGVFDGNNKTISNLTMTGVGLFGYVSKDNDFGVGTIQDLTLSGCHLTSNNYAGGGIVAELSGGAIVSNCTIVNSTIACAANQYNPEQGGIVGRLSGTSTVTGCVVNNVQVKAETTYTGGSGALGITGGIVGKADGGTISSCAVRNGSKITCYYADESAELDAGALVGKNSETTLSGNYYDYDVTVEMLNGTDTENKITKSGYTQRAIGGEVWNEQTQENEPTPDVADNNGAVMYTQTVTVPSETEQASVTAEENTYYSVVELDNEPSVYAVAPGQAVMLNITEGEGYVINTFTATNTTTGTEIEAGSEDIEDNLRQYTFTMPDAPVTVAVTAVAAYGVSVAGIEVTELNYTDVLGDGKVSFTLPTQAVEPQTESTPATLTLNGATINGNVVSSLTTDLYIHLQGSNVINAGEKSAFVSTGASSTQTLVFTTNATTPGQLLIKTSSNSYKENFYDAFGDGLTQAAASGKRLIAVAPTMTPTEGLYWTDQQFTVSGPSGSTLYYKNNINSEETAYTEPFTLAAGNYSLCAMRKVTVDETEFSLYGSSIGYVVHAKPAFSQQAGTYVGQQSITLTNLPSNLGISNPEAATYPQVWYYLGENVNDSVNISSAEQAIAVSESTKVTVYILDEDSGKVYKSAKVEAEYTILQPVDYHFTDSESGQSYYGNGSTVSNLNFGQENTLPWLMNVPEGLPVTYSSSDEAVATVDAEGHITLTGAGYVKITASNEATSVYAAHEEWVELEIRPSDPQLSLNKGIYYTGTTVTMTPTVGNGTMYYKIGYNGELTAYTGPITLPAGTNEIIPITRCGTEEKHMDSYGNAHQTYFVYDEPQFSVTDGSYNQTLEVAITTNIPAEDTFAAIYYKLNDSKTDSTLYEAGSKISITESTKVSAYIHVRESDDYVSDPVEAHYVIRQDAGLAFTDASDEPAEVAEYTIGVAEEQQLPTLHNENKVTVAYSSSNTDVATVNATTGVVTPVGVGKTTITATSAQTDIYLESNASYMLRVYKNLNHESVTVTIADADLVYDRTAKQPTVTLTDGTAEIGAVCYNKEYTNNTNAGTATVTITAAENLETENFYKGSVSKTFTIQQAALTEVTLSTSSLPYNGESQSVTVTSVKAGELELTADEYSVDGNTATAVGGYTVTVSAKPDGNFTGSATADFSIVNRTLAVGTDVTFADGQTWASYYTTTEDLELPEKVMAYIVTAVSETAATVAPISYVPKNVPVLLENNSTVTTENTDATGNLLAGTTEAIAVAGLNGTVYGLHGNRFLKVTSGSIPAHRAYLVTGTEVVAPAGAPYLNIIFGDATAIDRVKADAGDGDGQWYTLDGRKLQQKPAKKGLYIKNGRKVVINNK